MTATPDSSQTVGGRQELTRHSGSSPLLPDDLWEVLACPRCRGDLSQEQHAAFCPACGVDYPFTDDGRLDLRLRGPIIVSMPITLGEGVVEGFAKARLEANSEPTVDLGTLPLPPNVTRRFASYLPKAQRSDARVLDLGCGSGVDRPLLEKAGYRWYGIDYYDSRAPIMADGHALPFKDSAFDLVFSIAVLECFQYPHVALSEVARVLRPGGQMTASVAFLTPYIPLTQFHWSHVGVLNVLRSAGLQAEVLLADRHWSLLEAGATLGLFPRMPTRLATALVRPLYWLHRLWWRLGPLWVGRPLSDVERTLRNAADIEFVAVKPEAPPRG